MNWLFLTAFAVLSRAIYGIATKIFSSTAQVSAVSQSFILTAVSSVLALAISPAVGGISFQNLQTVWISTIAMVLSQVLGNVTYFKGIEKLEASITQIAFSSIVIWGTLLSSLFLGSHFTFLQIGGIILLLGAILLIQYKKGKFKLSTSMLYVFVSAGFFAIFQVTSAQLSHTVTAGTYLLLANLGTVVFLGVVYLKKVYTDIVLLFKNLKNVTYASFFASSTSLLYFLFSYFAYQVAPDRGVVVLLLTTQVIVSVILGIIFLKERDRMLQKIIAGMVAVVASILIKI